MKGGMQSHPLLVTSVLDHAATWDGEQVTITACADPLKHGAQCAGYRHDVIWLHASS